MTLPLTQIPVPVATDAVSHTQGPWTCDKYRYVYVEGGRIIATANQITAKNLQAQEIENAIAAANARLIAAAPELLDALENLFALVKGECPSLLNEDSGGDAELCLKIEKAISKAKGES